MKNTIRTRIAPSPTGFPHIGTIYQALFNYAVARKQGGAFLVRIEDTDRTRFVEGAEDVIFSALDWFGLTEDESARKDGPHGPYRQSERLEIYHTYAQELLKKGHAYFAYYPKADAGKKKDYTQQTHSVSSSETTENPPTTIEEMIKRGDWIVRMKVPQDPIFVVKDEVRGEITFENRQITEQVLLKSDGFPTYHLAAVVDDHLMEISHIVRAEEWLSSLPKHVILFKYFGWDMPPVFHTSLLRNPDKSKLSKRHGHTDVLWYKNEGYLPEAILNYLALLGWTHPEEKEIFSFDEFVQLFDLKDMRPVAPIFDLNKLTWMNQQYIQSLSDEELRKRIIAFYPKAEALPDALFAGLLPLLKTRMDTLKVFETLTEVFFDALPSVQYSVEEKELGKAAYTVLEKIEQWDKEMILDQLRALLVQHKVRMSALYKLFIARERGLPLPDILELLGKEQTLARLKQIV